MNEEEILARMEELQTKYPNMTPQEAVQIALGRSPAPAMEQVGEFIGQTNRNLMSIPKGIMGMVSDPIGTMKASGSNFLDHMQDAKGMMEKGDWVRGGVHGLAAIPELFGLPTARAHDEMIGGNYGTGLADAVFAGLAPSLPGLAAKGVMKVPGVQSATNMGKYAGKLGMDKAQPLIDKFMGGLNANKGAAPSPPSLNNPLTKERGLYTPEQQGHSQTLFSTAWNHLQRVQIHLGLIHSRFLKQISTPKLSPHARQQFSKM
jgi:hypothetical protein